VGRDVLVRAERVLHEHRIGRVHVRQPFRRPRSLLAVRARDRALPRAREERQHRDGVRLLEALRLGDRRRHPPGHRGFRALARFVEVPEVPGGDGEHGVEAPALSS
jgi:hypothetical protein